MPSGLLNVDGEPKPVYHVLDELINQQWNTSEEGELSDQAMVEFRGFYGSYEVSVNIDGQLYLGYFDATKESDKNLTVTINKDENS